MTLTLFGKPLQKIDTRSMSAGEIRDLLVQNGVDPKVANNIKGKTKLGEKLNSLNIHLDTPQVTLTAEDNILDGVEEVQEEVVVIKTEEVVKDPVMTDIGWQDFVLSKFDEDELDNGYPKVNGLRRVVELLLGPITYSGAEEYRSGENASCRYLVHIKFKDSTRAFGGIASSNENNTDQSYSKYAEAVAETRAEGRALRKALRLSIVCAEEMVRGNAEEKQTFGEWNPQEPISSGQITLIKTQSSRLKIDLDKFIKENNFENLESLKKLNAIELIKKLNLYQTGREEVPLNILLSKGE